MQSHIEASLDVLSPSERSAFVLKHMNGLTIKDTAAAMDVATGTIKGLLYRATRKLRDELAFDRDDITSAFPVTLEAERNGNLLRATGRLNGGGPTIRIRTRGGSVELREGE